MKREYRKGPKTTSGYIQISSSLQTRLDVVWLHHKNQIKLSTISYIYLLLIDLLSIIRFIERTIHPLVAFHQLFIPFCFHKPEIWFLVCLWSDSWADGYCLFSAGNLIFTQTVLCEDFNYLLAAIKTLQANCFCHGRVFLLYCYLSWSHWWSDDDDWEPATIRLMVLAGWGIKGKLCHAFHLVMVPGLTAD